MDPPRGVSGWTGGAVLDILLSGTAPASRGSLHPRGGMERISRDDRSRTRSGTRVLSRRGAGGSPLDPGPAFQGKRDAATSGRGRSLDRRPDGAFSGRSPTATSVWEKRPPIRSKERHPNPTASTASGSSSGTPPMSRRFSGESPSPSKCSSGDRRASRVPQAQRSSRGPRPWSGSASGSSHRPAGGRSVPYSPARSSRA